MCAKEIADWLVGIGTLVLAIAAIAQDHIRRLVYSPKFHVSIKTDPPDCMAVPENMTKQLAPTSQPMTVAVNALYLRIAVKNVGSAPALNAEVYAQELFRQRADGSWESVREFPPMNLTWADVGGMYFPRIAPGMSKHCDVASIYDPVAFASFLGGPIRSGLDPKKTTLSFLTISRPNHMGNVVGPGEYRLTILVAAENARPMQRTLRLSLPANGVWYRDPTEMLRDGVGVYVEDVKA